MSIRNVQKFGLAAAKPVRARTTRQQQLIKLLKRKSGVSITQVQKAFGWQPHSARAALSELRKSGTVIERSDTEKGSVYRIAGEG